MKRIYTNPNCAQFVQDMEEAGFGENVRHYHGRWFWSGPAVFTDERNGPSRDDVIRATHVKLQYDNLAFDWVCYPRSSDEGTPMTETEKEDS